MLEAGKVEIGHRSFGSRSRRCLICDESWSVEGKRCWSPARDRTPQTWVNRTVILLSLLNAVLADGKLPNDGSEHYSRQWAVKIEGGQDVADRIAAKHGFVNLGKIIQDFYHFEHKRVAKRSTVPHTEYHRNLVNEVEVKWAEQQIVKRRSKRDLITLRTRSKSNFTRFNDVEWPTMWYLNRGQGLDMNVQGAWRDGISGSGVVVTILDDGLEKSHPDLIKNYDPQASYDVNNHDEDPMPRYDSADSNRHGTRCAGEVAAVANNSLCSVGVAFGASVGGVRMLDGDVTDAVEARSLSLNPQHIDIYSASWGPDDDGKTVDGPGELATRAFIEGVTKGRQGKGSIFVWASGNGGREHDNCNCDGYTNSIWTLSISSATEKGLVPWYSEACSSTLATTYSSGAVNEKQIVTTDLRHKCTNGHTGTSASAPLAAGICALALEANRDLTWRDMQHIVVRTARPANLKSSDWRMNGVGRNVSHSFGYGLMDATAMVRLAKTWKTVPEQRRCEVSAPHVDKPIPPRSKVILKLNVTECAGVNFLEHVQAKISLSSAQRGGLQIYLTSPAGTRATLLARRPQDLSRNPFTAWPFMSVHTWGEMPFGVWQLEIHYEGHFVGRAILQEWSLLFYGTMEVPWEAPNHKPYRPPSNRPPSAPKTSSKTHKVSAISSPSLGRKGSRIWKGKTGNSRTGKISGGNSAASKTTHPSAKNSKTTQKVVHSGRGKDSGRGVLKTTSWAPPSTHGSPLTIVLGPGGDLGSRQKVPDVFQKYPKMEQLFPFYVNGGRPYGEENYLCAKAGSPSPSGHTKFHPKSKSSANGQKAERQNRFDASSLPRGETPKKAAGAKYQIQGHFEGWQMLFYGTEVAPEAGDREGGQEGPGPGLGTSSGCVPSADSAYRCIECEAGLYLYEGRCEAICPPKTYPGRVGEGTATCLPCHYTCLTCAGGSDGHCVSCYEEAVAMPSGLEDFTGTGEPETEPEPENVHPKGEQERRPEGYAKHLSWGKRTLRFTASKNRSKKAVTKKVLELHHVPRPLYYCYPSAVMDRFQFSAYWYRRMTVLFAFNVVVFLAVMFYLVWTRWRSSKREQKHQKDESTWKYLKMSAGDPSTVLPGTNVLYLSSSSDEEDVEMMAVGTANGSIRSE